jgi:hypothetical protein
MTIPLEVGDTVWVERGEEDGGTVAGSSWVEAQVTRTHVDTDDSFDTTHGRRHPSQVKHATRRGAASRPLAPRRGLTQCFHAPPSPRVLVLPG